MTKITSTTSGAIDSVNVVHFHKNRSVTLWDVYRQQWVRTHSPSDRVLASLCASQRARVIRHVSGPIPR